MVKQNNSRAQGTIEYLVIIAVVVVIALVVVALILNMTDYDQVQIMSNKNQNLIGKGGISIIDSAINSAGEGVILFQNTLGESLTIKSITPGAESSCEKMLSSGTKYSCYLTNIDSVCPCNAKERVICDFKINFETKEGIQKSETFTIINDCTDQPITNPNNNLLINLISPNSGTIVTSLDSNTNFNFRANKVTTDCNLYIKVGEEWNFARRKIQNTPRNTPITIDANVASFGTNVNSWKIQCADEENNTGESQDREITYSPATPPTTYTITYDDNGATSGEAPTDESAYASGATVTVLGTNTMEKEGYTFLHWKNNSTQTTYDEDDTFTITSNTTLYAQWEEEVIELECDEPLAGGYYCNGSGTLEDPYGITTIEMLQNITQNLDANYVLLTNIDAINYSTFSTIGGVSNPFTGTLDGKGHSITNFSIDKPSDSSVGMFASLSGEIKNLTLEIDTIKGYRFVSGLVVTNRGLISDINLTINNRLSSEEYVCGGIAGSNEPTGIIRNTHVTINGILTGTSQIGGIAGQNPGGTITLSSTITNGSGIIQGSNTIGGITGSSNGGSISQVYSDANIIGGSSIGGIAGSITTGGTLSNCYSISNLQFTGDYIGGIVGAGYDSTIINCYSTGNQPMNNIAGIHHSWTTTIVENSYWNNEIFNTVGLGTELNTTQMKQSTNYSGWDFDTVWNITNGTTYPYLKNNTQSPNPQ